MPAHARRTDLPVAVLYNLDPSWDEADLTETRSQVALLVEALQELGHPLRDLPVEGSDIASVLRGCDPRQWIVLNWIEDLPGVEQGDVTAASTLRRLGYTYTGSAPEALARSYDKPRCKRILDAAGVPTPPGRMYHDTDVGDWTAYPAIVKAAYAHCSTGITSDAVVLDARALAARVEYVLTEIGQPALVESFVDGREFHVSLWGADRLEMLPPAEMDFAAFADVRDRLCTWDSKFRPGSRHFEQIEVRLPCELSATELRRLERTCREACEALGCRDYARVDARQHGKMFQVLEVNPNPDITADTSFALAAALQGISYGELGSRLVNLAAARHPVYGRKRARPPRRRASRLRQMSLPELEAPALRAGAAGRRS